jgi:hypothetical protein
LPKPDFLIIGAQKCGTSSLFHYLRQHPDLSLPLLKEIQFFSLEYSMGWKWYKDQFPEKPFFKRRLTGEASPYYLFHPLVPVRVAKHLPGVKLIVMMRNPVDRAYSHFWHEKKYKTESLDSFEEAIAKEPERTSEAEQKLINNEITQSQPYRSFSYLSRGMYFKQISGWLQFYPIRQMHFIKSENFFENPETELAELYRFLGIRQIMPVNLTPQNTNTYPKLEPEIRERVAVNFIGDGKKLSELLGDKFIWNNRHQAK